jgi:hypothetical protein
MNAIGRIVDENARSNRYDDFVEVRVVSYQSRMRMKEKAPTSGGLFSSYGPAEMRLRHPWPAPGGAIAL